MPIIDSTHRVHAATCCDSEGTRQQAVAAAILAGGGSATIAAAVRTAEIAHYRRVIASGTLVPGDRMPSVRALMHRHQVSLSTALQVFRRLEDAGWL